MIVQPTVGHFIVAELVVICLSILFMQDSNTGHATGCFEVSVVFFMPSRYANSISGYVEKVSFGTFTASLYANIYTMQCHRLTS
jgi:hypothetical protein